MELKRCKTAAVAAKEEEEEESSGSWLSEAPVEILAEILMRVPKGKQAFQLKLVSKHWNFILSHPYFLHRAVAFHRHHGKGFFTLLCHQNMKTTPLLALKVPSGQGNGNGRIYLDRLIGSHHLSLSWSSTLKIAASCNDLLLLEHLKDKFQYQYYVVNFQTRHWVALPPPPSMPDDAVTTLSNNAYFKAGLMCHYNYNYNYDDATTFKVIRILCVAATYVEIAQTLPMPGLYRPDFSVHIYSSDSNQWSQYTADWYPFRLTHYLTETPIVSHDGMFHWVNGRALLSLNPFDLVCHNNTNTRLTLNRTVELPEKTFLNDPEVGLFHDFRNGKVSSFLGIGVVLDHLRIVTRQIHGADDCSQRCLLVWQLDESKIGAARARADGPWSLVYNVLLSEFPFKRISLHFLACHPYEGDVLLVQILKSIYQFNLRTQKLREHKQVKPFKGNLNCVLPPLLHHWLPTSLASLSP